MLLLSLANFFFKKITFKKTFKNTIEVPNGLDPDQDRRFVGHSCFYKSFQQTTKVTDIKKIKS